MRRGSEVPVRSCRVCGGPLPSGRRTYCSSFCKTALDRVRCGVVTHANFWEIGGTSQHRRARAGALAIEGDGRRLAELDEWEVSAEEREQYRPRAMQVCDVKNERRVVARLTVFREVDGSLSCVWGAAGDLSVVREVFGMAGSDENASVAGLRGA